MLRLILVSALFACAIAAPCEEFSVTYKLPNPAPKVDMDISACRGNNTIYAHLADSEDFDGIDSIEDYDSGFAATVVQSQEGCFIGKLKHDNIDDQVSHLKSKSIINLNGNRNLISVPVDDVASEFGDRVAEFCGEFPVFKVGKDGEEPETEELADQEQNERTIGITFRKCCLFFGACTFLTLTYPTGTTITFFWFYG